MPKQRTPRNLEAEFSYIVHTVGEAELTLWIRKHGTVNQWLWWMSRILEAETGEEITNALDIAALGKNEADNIRVAGHYLKIKIVKAFLKPKLTKPILTNV